MNVHPPSNPTPDATYAEWFVAEAERITNEASLDDWLAVYRDDVTAEWVTDGVVQRYEGVAELTPAVTTLIEVARKQRLHVTKSLVAFDPGTNTIVGIWSGGFRGQDPRQIGTEIWTLRDGKVVDHRMYGYLSLRPHTSLRGKLRILFADPRVAISHLKQQRPARPTPQHDSAPTQAGAVCAIWDHDDPTDTGGVALSETGADGRSQRSEATRQALVTAARNLFAEHGYSSVSTGDIARATGMTRNAIYYHFPNKESLFRAVYHDVEQELVARVVPAALKESSPRRQLEVGCAVFLDGCMDPAVTMCVLEAPGVLGFQQMREIASENYLAVMREGIRIAIEAGDLPDLPVDTLASMLIGALDEAALLIGTAKNHKQARKEAGQVAQALIDGLFTSAA